LTSLNGVQGSVPDYEQAVILASNCPEIGIWYISRPGLLPGFSFRSRCFVGIADLQFDNGLGFNGLERIAARKM
jgi:hypothetical protein